MFAWFSVVWGLCFCLIGWLDKDEVIYDVMHEDNQTDCLRFMSYQLFHLDVKHNKTTLGLPSSSPTLIINMFSFFLLISTKKVKPFWLTAWFWFCDVGQNKVGNKWTAFCFSFPPDPDFSAPALQHRVRLQHH